MSEPASVLVVALESASTERLREAVRARVTRAPARFHLLVPKMPPGMHQVVDPEETGAEPAGRVLAEALPKLREAAGSEVTGSIGDPDPLAAIENAINLGEYDEIIISTLPPRISRWLKLDLASKVRGLGLPVTHVEELDAAEAPADPEGPRG